MSDTTRNVVVGVGFEEVGSALAYAVEEARRHGCGVHLVHAVQLVPAGPETMLVAQVDLEHLGQETMAAAVKEADDLVGDDVPLTREIHRGSPVPVLVHAGEDARLVVLEHRHRSRLGRIVTRSVAGGVAARSHTPVVSVPTGWRRSEETERVVVVGVDEPERSSEVLRTAFAEARARGASLRVVNAWSLPDPYEGMGASLAEQQAWSEESVADVKAAIAELGDDARGVEAEIRISHGRPADALVEAAEQAELLVVGRHDPLIPIGSHLGSVARAVVHESRCPVLLTSPGKR